MSIHLQVQLILYLYVETENGVKVIKALSTLWNDQITYPCKFGSNSPTGSIGGGGGGGGGFLTYVFIEK